MKPWIGQIACVVAALAPSLPCAAGASRGQIAIDVKEVELAEVLRLLASQGGPKIVAAPDGVPEKVTFAVKGVTGHAAARWLCRVQGLVARKKDGTLVMGGPAFADTESKEYRVSRLATSQAQLDGLVRFIERTILAAYPSRATAQEGQPVPTLEATSEKGRLKVVAPSVVQREVVALLTAASKATKPRSVEELSVPYQPHEIGLFGPWGAGRPPEPRGEVSIDVSDKPADEVMRALTVASSMSYFVDPWDKALREKRLSISLEKAPLPDAMKQVETLLGAERVWYDGAWVFVVTARRPLFEGLIVRAYNVSGVGPGSFVADAAERMAKSVPLPPGLPYSIDRVGDHLLACAPLDVQGRLETWLTRPLPGPGRWRP